MTEKLFKKIRATGTVSLVIGIISLIFGIAAGVLLIINGARLISHKSENLF